MGEKSLCFGLNWVEEKQEGCTSLLLSHKTCTLKLIMLNVFCLMKRTKLDPPLKNKRLFLSCLKFKTWLHKPMMYSWKQTLVIGNLC